jgi:hypothetical protein
MSGFEPCAGAAAFAGSASGTLATGIGVVNLLRGNGKASLADVVVSVLTTGAGWTKYAAKGFSSVGFGISVIQSLWDHRDNQ